MPFTQKALAEGRPYFSRAAFWSDLAERSISTAAQAALGVVTAAGFGLVELASWQTVGAVAGTAALVAVLKAFAVGRTDATTLEQPAPPARYMVGERGPEVVNLPPFTQGE